VFWVRNWVSFPQRDSTAPLGLQVRAFGAFEVYWDGTLIGRNGRAATPAQAEVPGTETSFYLVPEPLAKPGRHLVALRATQAHFGDQQRFIQVRVNSYPRMLRDPLIIMSLMNLIGGALLIAAIYYLFLFMNSSQKQNGVLVFSLICFLSFALLMLEYAKYYIAIPYPHFYTRLQVIGLLTFAIALLVPLYFTIQFGLKRKRVIACVLLALLTGIYIVYFPHYDLTALRLSQAMWAASLVIVLLAMSQKAKGSALVLTGLLVSALSSYFLVFEFSQFITFAVIVLCMLYLHAIRVKVMEKEHQSAQLLSARLQLDLLKKNIQPHFIKNTLTSMLDWVEESPRQGAVFIEALAKEFDLLNHIAEATLIPVGTELALCRHHLQVMQFRKEIRYELQQTGIDETDLIPPAIFHTVLENGITHSLPPADGVIRFKLRFQRTSRYRMYTLLTCAPGRPVEKGRNVPAGTEAETEAGTGFRYIRARLRESYGSRWEFSSNAVPEGWLTCIKIAQTA
jgi:hypothetical protein